MDEEVVNSATCTMWSYALSTIWTTALHTVGMNKSGPLLGCSSCLLRENEWTIGSKKKSKSEPNESSKETALKRLFLAPPGSEYVLLNNSLSCASLEERALSDNADSESSYVSLSQLPLEVAPQEEENSMIMGKIGYTVAADDLVNSDSEKLALMKSLVIPVRCEIRNARVFERRGLRPPQLHTHGFELLSNLEMMLPCSEEEQLPSYYRELERIVRRATGADAVKVVSNTRRMPENTKISKKKISLNEDQDDFAHIDQSVLFWAKSLPDLDRDKIPKNLTRIDTLRAKRAARYAVITAWRYLGPTSTCHHSHLALLDPTTVENNDICLHKSYCLKAPDLDDPTANVKRHSWWYYPAMSRDSELLLFTVFDTNAHSFAKANTFPIPSIFHSTFKDPSGYHEPERDSMEVQLLVIWDDIDDVDDDEASVSDDCYDHYSTASTSSILYRSSSL